MNKWYIWENCFLPSVEQILLEVRDGIAYERMISLKDGSSFRSVSKFFGGYDPERFIHFCKVEGKNVREIDEGEAFTILL